MKIVYISNSCEHVVRPFCDGLYSEYGDDFKFIEVVGLDPARAGIGSLAQRDYVFNMKDNPEMAKKLCDEADIVIFAIVDLYYIKDRIAKNKPTIYYSERLFKKGILSLFKPKNFFKLKKYFIDPSKNSNFYLLAASSYAANDFYIINSFKNKIFKWGYQVEIYQKDIDKLMSEKASDGLDFIWVGRLVKLKHCDQAILVIKKLKESGLNPRLTIIGYGTEEDNLKNLVKKLDLCDNVTFLGKCSIEKTRQEMDKANIFLFTSDKKEGWGATLNEAMNSACACVACKAAGSTDFLIENEKDGIVYNSGDVDALINAAEVLATDKPFRETIARAAYNKVFNVWNPKKSYKRLCNLLNLVLEHKNLDVYESGPCSKAHPNK